MTGPNTIDRMIGYFAPRVAARRVAARAQVDALAALGGGYAAGRPGARIRKNWRPGNGSADADIVPELPDLRALSRDLVRNVPMATAPINRVVTFTVGSGLKPVPNIDADGLGLDDARAEAFEAAAAREFAVLARSRDIDASRMQDFYGLQALAFRAVLESGDVFVVLRQIDRQTQPYRLALQFFEADQVSNPDNARDGARLDSGRGNRVVGGIELDDFGAAVRVHIATVHPGNIEGRAERKWISVPIYGERTGRRQVLHLFDRQRPGQTRGVPYLAPVIESLKQLGTFAEAELWAAVVSSMFAVVFKTPDGEPIRNSNPADARATDAPENEIDVEPGSVVTLESDAEVSVPSLGRPNSEFDPFFVAIVRQIGAALELPFEVLIMHFTASYSASRAALEMAYQFIRGRREWLAVNFCQPVYEEFLHEAVGRARLAAPGFFSDAMLRQCWCGAEWNGPARIAIQPLPEYKADEIAVAHGWKTEQQVTAERTGGNWRVNARHRLQEIQVMGGSASGGGDDAAAALPADDRPDSEEQDT